MLRTMAAAYKNCAIARCGTASRNSYGLQPADRHAHCIWTIRLATSRRNGCGYGGSDFIDTRPQRSARAEDVWEEIFPTMMGDDRAIAATYVAGQKV